MTFHAAVYSTLVLLLAYWVRGVAGFGSGLIAIPLLSLAWPVTTVVPIVVALDYLGSLSQGARNVEEVAWREQLVLIPFMVVGVIVGLWVLRVMSVALLGRFLGAFVILYAIYQMLPLRTLSGSRIAASYCGFLGGLVGTLFGTGGPFYVIYLNLRGLERPVFRATFAMNFLIDGGVRLAAFVAAGHFGGQTLAYLLAAIPAAGVGLYLGGHVQTRLSQRTFQLVIQILLLVSGLALLLKR
ncbi:MAG TPA: sulfite exporter TauE/SafE family protein [Candidatus Bathyarchaeia archaeon]|nr:sulfite exporter TauE/SafE family protein [Candidatus Bathyarchaeia archaeon]